METPAIFCWTKMGTEAGQPLETILARKEAERELGFGTFFWGIGNALGSKLWHFVASVPKPMVFFTLIKSKPKQIDVSPKRVVAWRAFVDREGIKHPMPDHVFVTSRASDRTFSRGSHFALVCRKDSPLSSGESCGSICIHSLMNFSATTKVAFSQVTAIVSTTRSTTPLDHNYSVLFAAELVHPYYVKLVDPVDVPPGVLAEINRLRDYVGFGAARWARFLKAKCAFRATDGSGQLGLFRPAVSAAPHTPRVTR
jgi:hypothetical protein